MGEVRAQPARHAWLAAALALGLLAQGALSGAVTIRREARTVAGLPAGAPAPEVGGFPAFVARHVPEGENLLYASSATGSGQTFDYFRISYAAYPAQAWWTADAPHDAANDWWIPAQADGPSLVALARQVGATYLALDGVAVPGELAGAERWDDGAGRSVLRLPERSQAP